MFSIKGECVILKEVELTKYTKFSGCGAKLGPGVLAKALCGLEQPAYERVMSDFNNCEDAGVYRVNNDLAMVQTLDFFPPIVDDPYVFGQIAAANSLSDVFAMGAKASTALSIVAFPQAKLDIKHLRLMMDGGLSKLIESETALIGGHSIEDDEVKFGYSVTGFVHPDKVLENNTAKAGDALILTKPIGTGVINTALRASMVKEISVEASIESMRTLNKKSSEIINSYSVSACTDVTGFGLLGHACEMISGTNVGIEIDFQNVPLLPEVKEYISMGLIPAGTYRNKEYRGMFIDNFDFLSNDTIDLLFDPQTSGGLLFTIDPDDLPKIKTEFSNAGIFAAKIGCINSNAGKIRINE